MTRCGAGHHVAAISRDGGASATHGELRSKSKYTAPVRRTARSTSESTSRHAPASSRTRGHAIRTPEQVGTPLRTGG